MVTLIFSFFFFMFSSPDMTQTGKWRRRSTRDRSRSNAEEPWRDLQVGITTRIHEQEWPESMSQKEQLKSTSKYKEKLNFIA